tara:strand:+ start:263 stop:607 length:345 start_codon:yes stop_codon:yes gene_type:complete
METNNKIATMIWNDPDPIEGNDYRIYFFKKICSETALIQYGGGSEAVVPLSEISNIDYFEHPNLLPVEVQEIINKYESETQCYITCKNLITELESVGWTCDYGLSAEPYDLKPL